MNFYYKIEQGKDKIGLFPRYHEREKWQAANSELSAVFSSIGGGLLNKPDKWKELTREMYCEFSVNGNRSHYEDLYFERRYDLIDLVICECLEGKGRYFGSIACALIKICDELSWCLPAHNPDIDSPDLGAKNPTVDLFAAESGATIACALYLLGDELRKISPQAVERAERELSVRVKKPYSERDFWWTLRSGDKKPCNWSSWISANMLLTFVLTEDDAELIDKCALSASETVKKLYDYLPDDGECDEGVAYWNVSPLAVYNFVEIMRAASGGKVPLSEKLKKFAAYPHAMHISGGQYFNFGDCSPTPALDYPSAYRFALESENRAAAEFYRTRVNENAYIFSGHSTEMTAYRALTALFTRYEGGEGDATPHESAYYSSGMLMSAHVGKYSVAVKGRGTDSGHAHIDAGNYIIFKENEPVVIDVGSSRYTKDNFSEKRNTLWFVRSAYHNLPAVNGIEQNEIHSRAELISRGERLIKLDLTRAYNGAGLRKYLRTVTAENDGVEVRDEMEFTGNNNRAEFHIITAVRPEIRENALTVGNVFVLVSSLGQCSLKTETIPLQDDLLRSQWGEEVYRVTAYVSATGKSLEFWLKYI